MNGFAAIADPTRRRIVEMLAAAGRLSAGDISSRFDSSAPAISQHLKVLREAELVHMEKQAQQRIYSLNPAAFDDMESWISRMRGFWTAQFDALEGFLAADAETGPAAKGKKRKRKKIGKTATRKGE
ncbi:MAG: metalloregulator ArsR/SmtB family transcription factor [Alphaproteobacteria bacterium]|nr:metalloregulator ArsR/SmtB family transcription factor [Alphaproteobacteria bacterium]